MNEARHLLASTNLMTYEIAEKTGFADARYFSSSFKKNNGNTPSEFRALRREKP
jgi:two-component system response regulator YesN